MTKVDTWLGTPYSIYIGNDDLYYIVCAGKVVSPGFATLSAAQHNGYKYMKKDEQ